MTENEAVERMALALREAFFNACGPTTRDDWDSVARIALTSHPAVDALRECYDVLMDVGTGSEDFKKQANARYRAKEVLASLPKES